MPAAPQNATYPGKRRRLRVFVRGTVQGVGFRPFVYQQAKALGLTGWVENSPQGVTVEAEGEPLRVDTLVRTIRETPPPNASVTSIETQEIDRRGDQAFEIRASA